MPKKPEHVRPSRGLRRAGARSSPRRPWAVDRRRRARAARSSPLPVTQLRLGQPDDGNQPESRTQRVAYDQLSRGVRPGLQRPVPARRRHAEGRAGDRGRSCARSRRRSPTRPASPRSPRRRSSQDGEMATIFAIPTTAPQDAKTSRPARAPARGRDPAGDRRHAAEGLRRRQHRRASRTSPTRSPARLPLFIARRDRPVGAAADRRCSARSGSRSSPRVFNLLSVAAAYGVVVAVFQEGIGASLIGVDGGRPDRLVPPGDAVRDPVRAEHGLQRVPALAGSTRPTTRATGRARA